MYTARLFKLSFAALMLFPSVMGAVETKLLLVRAGSRPDGTTIVPPTKNSGTTPVYWNPPNGQHVIPRYANGATHPAGQLIGWGPTSVAQGTLATDSLPAGKRAIVITEDYDLDIGRWEYTTATHKAVLQPTIRDITIIGRDAAGNNYAGAGQVNDAGEGPLGSGQDQPLYDGLLWKASGGLIANVNFLSIPGKAAVLTGGSAGTKNAGLGVFDNVKLKVWNVNMARCFYGMDVPAGDASIGNISGHSIRASAGSGGYGLKLSGGATHIMGYLHFWGAEKNIWITGVASWGGPIYAESGPKGIVLDSGFNRLGPIYSHSCSNVAIEINSSNNTLGPIHINDLGNPQPLGILLANQYNQLLGGQIAVDAGGTGIRITNGTGQRIRDIGLGGGSNATLIDADAELNYCDIDVHLQDSGIGIDLNDDGTSRLGVHNTVNVVTPAMSGLTTIIDLPASWDSSNKITINGVEQSSP